MVFRKFFSLITGCFKVSDKPKSQPSVTETESVESTTSDESSALRIKLSDGRYLAYREKGVPKSKSNYRVIIVHGFGSSKEMSFVAPEVNKKIEFFSPFSCISLIFLENSQFWNFICVKCKE